MTEQDAQTIGRIAQDDQATAQAHSDALVTAAYYLTLTAKGIPDEPALFLTQNYQSLTIGLPAIWMGGDEE